MDADSGKPVGRKAAAAVRDAVKNYPDGELVEFPENLETTLVIDKQRPSIAPQAIRNASLDSSGPPELAELANALRRLARRA